MDIRELDPQDETQMRRHWEIGKAAESAQRPYDLFWPWESAWITHSQGRSDTRTALLGAFEGDTMWGAAQADCPLHDNTHAAFAEVFVHPDRQRQGIGRRLVEAGCDVVRREGRRVMMVEVFAPPNDPSPGQLFGRAMGFAEALHEGIKVVDLPATEHLWDGLAAESAPHHQDYRLVTCHDVVPDELLLGYCRLNEAFIDEAPMGDLDVEAEKWDEQRVREREARNARSRRHDVKTFALDADGEVVGDTEVIVNENAPWRGMQGGTLVLPEHRGHRLGLAMKIANQRAVRERWPSIDLVFTGNAGVNAPMNRVNDQLGFRFVERCIEMQKSL